MEIVMAGTAIFLSLFILSLAVISFLYRQVVGANEVHIIQKGNKNISYGAQTANGNVYYAFPSWIPFFGVNVIKLPVSVFRIQISDYEAYDLERLPFIVDLTAFFRISNSDLAAQRIKSMAEMESQLKDIIQGSVRSILSSRNLNEILQIRSEFGEEFTKSVKEQLVSWGLETVKNIELMDIRDSRGSKVIQDIMERKKSFIEKESRIEVAQNQREATVAEIEAKKIADIKRQEALKDVGLKTVENEREVAISRETAAQSIKEQERVTKEKEMEVIRVADVKKAEIDKSVEIVKAEQEQRTKEIRAEADKNVLIKNSEAEKQKAILEAEALLETKDKEAQGIQKIGAAEAEAKEKIEIATVAGQVSLAKEIGGNEGYQNYLISIRQVEATEVVGVEQAKALAKGEIKLLVNSGNVNDGLKNIGEVFSSGGGMKLGSMLEGFSQTDIGKGIIDKFLNLQKGNSDNLVNQAPVVQKTLNELTEHIHKPNEFKQTEDKLNKQNKRS